MKNLFQFTLYFLTAFVLFTSCNSPHKESGRVEAQSILDSLKTVYAPDTRVALWDVAINATSDTLIIQGEIDNQKAFDAIEKTFYDQFPNSEIKLTLLPENGQFIGALINNSVANLRSQPKHSAEIATQALLGTPIRVLKKQGEWYLVQTPNNYIAWVDDDGIVEINKKSLDNYKNQKKVVYNQLQGYSYEEPKVKSQTVSDLVMGCILAVISSKRKYYQVQYPDKRTAWVRKNEVIDYNEFLEKKPQESEIVKTAMKFMGLPYLWGGTSAKAVDCSGFTSTIYYMNGSILQRDASQQIRYGKVVSSKYESKNLLPGDLLFFGRPASDSLPEKVTHVAIYIGNSEFIHASGKVRINSMDKSRNNFIPEYGSRFVRAVRIIGVKPGDRIESISDNEFYRAIRNNSK